jgi:hypothetical protein
MSGVEGKEGKEGKELLRVLITCQFIRMINKKVGPDYRMFY